MDPWRIDDFADALTSLSDNTVAAYTSDLRSFAAWCARSDLVDPAQVKRTTVRRYLAHLTTRQFARRTIARKAAAIRRYYRWLVASGFADVDPTSGISVPAGPGRLPRVLDQRELAGLLDGSVPDGATAQNLVVAYEPVWAIGTGLTPTPGDVAEMHGHIRRRLASRLGAPAQGARILYGGSVKPSNARELMSVSDVDGALVGGASLDPEEFARIVRFVEPA